jgi:carnitine O-acetyltransferase
MPVTELTRGVVVEDGYGLSYAIDDNNLRWCVTTRNGDAQDFAKALVDAAEDLRRMMDRAKAAGAGGAGSAKAKL